MEPFNWQCGYCGYAQTVTSSNQNLAIADIHNAGSRYGPIFGSVYTIVCANQDCRELSLTFCLHHRDVLGGATIDGQHIRLWPLLPEGTTIPQPDYIPKPIVNDYKQACRIKNLSPNASAAISRRCLQGMIRDFWNAKGKGTLSNEIQAIRDHVPPKTWEAIDAVRAVGNIGAHMEEDVNLILDVEPDEAQALISLIELLFKDWYVDRHEREKRADAVVAIAQMKKTQANAATGKDSEEPPYLKA